MVLIADDSESMRSAIVRMIKDNPELEVVGEYSTSRKPLN
jgi:DNA-binding NarL/FixJ family response regulator